jgi:hypothetical protein
MALIDRLKCTKERLWYAHKTLENGWSRDVLETWIDSDLYSRQGKAITNFEETMPKQQSDLANAMLKDPYHFDFIESLPRWSSDLRADKWLEGCNSLKSYAAREGHALVPVKDMKDGISLGVWVRT